MAEDINRITLIDANGTAEHAISTGAVEYDGQIVMAGIPETAATPDWEQPGMEIVAGRADGSVAAAFTVLDIRRNVDHATRQGEWRIYLGNDS